MGGGLGKLLARVAMLALLVAGVGLPLALFNSGSGATTDEPTRITSYDATFDIDAEGTLRATERVTVLFPSYPERRGIFRYFDHNDDNAPTQRRVPREVEVTMDGDFVSTFTERQDRNRFTVVRVGSEYSTVEPGEHTYEITYTIDDVLLPTQDGSQFYWNVIPGGWAQAIDKATLTVRLPGEATQVHCYRGAGETSGCTADGEGTSTLRITESGLDPYTPVTVQADTTAAIATPAEVRPWSMKWERVLGPSWGGVLLTLAFAVAAGVGGALAGRATREVEPGFPLMYAPPEGIGPVQGTYLLTERVPEHGLVVTLMDMHEKGLVELSRNPGGWKVVGTSAWATTSADPVASSVARGLGVASAGASFEVRGKSVSGGETLQSVTGSVSSRAKQWARAEHYVADAGIGSFGGILCLAGLILALGVVILNPVGMSLVALVPGAFGIFALDTLRSGASTRRTPQARELWSRLGGFRRVLSTPSSEDRYDFAARQDTYLTYLPWAVAFGVADAWAAKYEYEMGSPPPQPTYMLVGQQPTYFGSTPGNAGVAVSSMLHDFDSTVSASISSYKATLVSTSSSSGGGFSGGFSSGGGGGFGGGGGGGGGGGSW